MQQTTLMQVTGTISTGLQELLDKEIIFQSDLERLIGERPFAKPTTYQAFTNGEPEDKKDKEAKVKKAKTSKPKAKRSQNGTESAPPPPKKTPKETSGPAD